MKTSDLVTGARHWWGLDKGEDLTILGWYLLIVTAVVIAGGPIWLAGVSLVPPLVIIAVGIWQYARDYRRNIGFYEWWLDANRDMTEAD